MFWFPWFFAFCSFSLSEGILNKNSPKINKECVLLVDDVPEYFFEEEITKINHFQNCNILKFGDEIEIYESIKSFGENLKVYLLISNDIKNGFLLEILREALNKNIKFYIFYKPKSIEESITNIKILSFATGGYFFDLSDNDKNINYEHMVENQSALGNYKHKLNILNSTKLLFIKINGDIENLEVFLPSGEKLNLINKMIVFENITFLTLKVNQNGPWTFSFDAKKRAYVNIIKEDARRQIQIQDQARFRRLVSSENIRRYLPDISIEIGSNSKLITRPYTPVNIYFEVTNNQAQSISVLFTCTDTKSLLQYMNPGSATMYPNQTVTVTIQLSGAIPSGSYDTISFSIAKYNAKKTAYLYVNDVETDSNPPEIWHNLVTDCVNVENSECQSKSWEVNIFARDKETGLFQFTSQPRGIYYDNDNFISGSKDEITGHYTGNCCNTKLTVTAIDVNGNKNTLEIDPYESAPVSAGFVSAIVLGVILLIVVIIIIVYFIIRQKQKGSLDLPTYRGPSGSRTPL